MERTRVVDPVGSVGNSDPERKGNEDPSLQNTVAPMWAAQPPEFKFTAEPVPRINPAWNGLEEWKAQQQDPEPTPPTPPDSLTGGIFDVDPNMSEVDRLKEQYRMMESQRFIVDPGPEHWQELKALANQIKALDPSFESPWVISGTEEPKSPFAPEYPFEEGPRDGPKTGPAPTPPVMIPGGGIDTTSGLGSDPKGYEDLKTAPPGFTHSGGPSTMAMVPFYNPTTGEEWTASSGGWSPAPGWVQGSKPADWKPPTSADPAPTLPDMPVQPAPEPLPESPAPKPPTFIDMDPLKGMRDQFVPRNILGQSYDPQVREDFVKKMQSGANITSTPSYQMPTSPIPQTQFGGYGQPMPMSPLAPYAGLGAAPLRPTDYDEPYDEDALPGGPSGPRDGGGVI